MESRNGWEIMLGISNSVITNGAWADDDESRTGEIEVFIPDFTPNAAGNPVDVKARGADSVKVEDPFDGTAMEDLIPRVQTIRCQYMGGHNLIVPCVHVNEHVWVLHHEGDQLGYFWLPIGRDLGLRLHEHIRWYAMNQSSSIKDGETSPVDDSNTYFVDINTNKGQKFIHVHTAINDGEPVGYDIRIMPEKEWLEIIDTKGNYLHLDSKETIWKMFNIMESYIELNKTDITISCLHNLTINVGNDMFTTVGQNQTSTIGANQTNTIAKVMTTTVAQGPMTFTCGSVISVNSPTYNNLCAAVNATGGKFAITGALFSATSTVIDFTAPAGLSIKGLITSVLTAHGNINLLAW